MKTLEQLQAELREAEALCDRYARPAHQVRNCPSDLQDYDQAHRRRRSIEWQIAELKKDLQKPIDFCQALDK
jgi:hypothetical protein